MYSSWLVCLECIEPYIIAVFPAFIWGHSCKYSVDISPFSYALIFWLRAMSTLRVSLAQAVKNLLAVQETWLQSLDWEDPLEKGMATHSSILACRWTEEPDATVHGVTELDMAKWLTVTFNECVIESACNAEDPGSIPGSGRSPGEENGNPLQYSCLGSPVCRGAWQAIVRGVAKSWTWLSD